jgi:hypothetical protein
VICPIPARSNPVTESYNKLLIYKMEYLIPDDGKEVSIFEELGC